MFRRKTSDQTLVRQMLAGQESAFTLFFDDYFPRLYRFALPRVGNDPSIAEEVVQSTLCAVMQKLDSYRGEAALFTWVCTFCRNEISTWFRKHKHREMESSLVEDTAEIRAALEALASVEEDQEHITQRAEIARLVQVALDHMNPKHANVLMWKYMQGQSVKQIADNLSIGPKAAESLLTRAREAFKDGFTAIMAGLQEQQEKVRQS